MMRIMKHNQRTGIMKNKVLDPKLERDKIAVLIPVIDKILSLFRQMEISIKFDTVKSGWSIIYIEGSQVIIKRNVVFPSLKIDFGLANSANPDEMLHNAAFHLGLNCLQ